MKNKPLALVQTAMIRGKTYIGLIYYRASTNSQGIVVIRPVCCSAIGVN